MFSHTAKGQSYNTPLLERFIKDLRADSNKKYRRLIDYELLTDGDGKRTIGFGYHAGGSRFLPLIFFNTDGFCYAHL
jgi:alpha-aminoadipic semialdehyde synthase